MRSELPLLASIEIASPCPMSWATMEGSETKRYCDSCKLHVHDLSSMTSQEAETLLRTHSGELCVRYTPDSEGRVLTDEFPTPLRPLRSLVLKYCATAAAFVMLLITTGIHQASAETKPSAGKSPTTKKLVKKAPTTSKSVRLGRRLAPPALAKPAPKAEGRPLMGEPTSRAVTPPLLGKPVTKPANPAEVEKRYFLGQVMAKQGD
jgi:hypothetical protein